MSEVVRRFQTIELPLELETEGVLEGYKSVVVSIQQREITLEKTESEMAIDVANNMIYVPFSQNDTGRFRVGKAIVQVNILNQADRLVSEEAEIEFAGNLHTRVMV